MDDVLTVTKADVDREYHVFLFERMILCCKDASPRTPRKTASTKSLLAPASTAAAARRSKTSLHIKGRIFINNVSVAQPEHDTSGSFTVCCKAVPG